MNSTDLIPWSGASSSGESRSALSDFLSHVETHSKGIIPRDLIQFGLYGSAVMILTSLIALCFPSPHSISHGEFFLLFGRIAAGLAGFLHALAIPGLIAGILLVGVDVYLAQVPTTEHSRWVVIGQAAAGGFGGTIGVLFLALFLFNLALWIVIMAAIIGGCLMLLGALASGG